MGHKTHTVTGNVQSVDHVGGSTYGNPIYRVTLTNGASYKTQVDNGIAYAATNFRPHSLRRPVSPVVLTLTDYDRIVDMKRPEGWDEDAPAPAAIIVTETPVYTWEKLSEKAKDHAREAHSRFLWEDGSAQESMELIWSGVLEDEGWENVSDLSYSLYSQGGEPMWNGDIPAFQHEGGTYYVQIRKRPLGGSSHAWDVTVDEGDGAPEFAYGTPEYTAHVAHIESVECAAKDYARGLSTKIFWQMREEDEYMTNDEQMAETSEANGYLYDEDGNLT